MSSYATPTDLAQLAISGGALSGISAPDQQAALDAASGVADGYLRARYTLPLTGTIDAGLVRAVCSIAAYDLLTRRGYNPETGDSTWRLRYEDAISWLKGVSTSAITPALTDSSTDRSSTGSTPAAPKVLSNATRGW